MGTAIALTLGIGIQNLPEGVAISIPFRGEGISRIWSWWYGQVSAVVEPVAAVIGAALVLIMQPAIPFALAFAEGAMIFVVVEEVIPEAHLDGYVDLATLGFLADFVIMMVLDISFG
jgi:ZIP family zinc transporter